MITDSDALGSYVLSCVRFRKMLPPRATVENEGAQGQPRSESARDRWPRRRSIITLNRPFSARFRVHPIAAQQSLSEDETDSGHRKNT